MKKSLRVLRWLYLPLVLCGFSWVATSFAADAEPKEPDKTMPARSGKWSFEPAANPNPSLPRVLLIGDSIAIGYKAMVIKALAGKANVDVWPNPFFQSEKLNQQLARILKHGPYAVVHVNVGLHGVEEGRIKPGTFEPLTRAYMQVIRDTMPKAKIIWANTTQFTIKGKPTELDPVKNPTVLEHNRIAAKLMADMLATAADVLEVKLPDNAGEDSISLLPVLLGKQPPTPLRKAIFVQGDTDDNAIAICSGRWKVIESTNARKEKVHQLYDLTTDPGETADLAKEHPEVVKQLAAGLDQARADGRTPK